MKFIFWDGNPPKNFDQKPLLCGWILMRNAERNADRNAERNADRKAERNEEFEVQILGW